MVVVIMEVVEIRRENRVRKTLQAIFETLVEDHGMEPNDVGSLMVEAGYAVAGKEGDVYLCVVIREIEKRIEKPLFEDKSLVL
jgi:hypothetical protein